MTYILGCIKLNDQGEAECDPTCCDPPPPEPNVNVAGELVAKGVDPDEFYEASACCFGPWDIFVKQSDGRGWMLETTVYCLTDVRGLYKDSDKEYVVVLSGETKDWDPVKDPRTPECFWEVDPYEA
jgi:hypothetical protein